MPSGTIPKQTPWPCARCWCDHSTKPANLASVGGGTVTDLPIRNVFYPEQGRETGRGIVLASYTWSEDAQRWGSLSPQDRVSEAVEQLSLIHPQILTEFEAGASYMWHEDQFAGAHAKVDRTQRE